MTQVGFEPTISAGERPETYALDRTTTAIGIHTSGLGGLDLVTVSHDHAGTCTLQCQTDDAKQYMVNSFDWKKGDMFRIYFL